jgi:hypothetical protein
MSGFMRTPPSNKPPMIENTSPLGRAGWRRWRIAGLVALLALIGWVTYLQVNSAKTERTYTGNEVAYFKFLTVHDPQLGPLLRADPTGLVKTAEGVCTYRLDGHSEAQAMQHLHTVGGVPADVVPSLMYPAESAFCPVVLNG